MFRCHCLVPVIVQSVLLQDILLMIPYNSCIFTKTKQPSAYLATTMMHTNAATGEKQESSHVLVNTYTCTNKR